MKKVISIILSLVMLFSLLPMQTFAAEQYTDTAGNWAEGAIDRWSEYGVIEGSNGRFDPNGTLTRAQMAAILSRLLALPEAKSAGFSDVAQTDWFAPYINSCYAAGIMQGSDGKAQPNDPITREQAIVMLSRALGIKPIENADLSGYTDAATVSDWAKGYVAAMAEAGIVKGTSATTVSPKASIDRAATVTILDRAIGTYANVDGAEVTAADSGIILIAADNVKVTGAAKNATVIVSPSADGTTVNGAAVAAGTTTTAAEEKQDKPVVSGGGGGGGGGPTPSYSDLTISAEQKVADGVYALTGGTYKNVTIPAFVGDGDVTLNNVTIKGELVVQGGGSNSIHLGKCKVDKIKVTKNSGQAPRLDLQETPVQSVEAVQPVIIEADTASTVKAVEAKSNVTVQGVATTVQSVSVPEDAGNVKLAVNGATVKEVEAEKPVVIEATNYAAPIEKVTAKNDVTVTGDAAQIKQVEVPTDAVKEQPVIDVQAGTVAEVKADKPAEVKGNGTVTNVEANAEVKVASETVTTITVTVQVTVTVTGNQPVEVSVAAPVSVNIAAADENSVAVSTTVNTSVEVKLNEQPVAHVHKWVEDTTKYEAPTCTTTGERVYTCSGEGACDKGNTKTETLPAKGHTADTVIPAQAATCTATGLTAGKKCSVCGTVLIAQTEVAATGHKYGTATYTWTKTNDGYTCTGKRVCENNGNHEETEIVTASYAVTTPATCEAKGLGTYTASFENSAFNAQTKTEDIAVLGHDYSVTQHDNAQHWMKCSRCDSTTAKTDHSYDTHSCTETAKCKGCDYVKPAGQHSYGDYTQTKAPTCTEKGSEHAFCSVCQHEDVREIAALGHSWATEFTIDTPATCTTVGSKSHHCTRCDAKTDVTEIAALNHNYGEATYTWAKDGNAYKCTATRICTHDASHKETETVTATYAVTTPAACETNGVGTYTATFTNEAFAEQTKTEEIAALGHDYTVAQHDNAQHWMKCSRCDSTTAKTDHSYDTHSCTETAKCKGCDYVKPAGQHSYGDYTQTKAPTCTENGSEKAVCTVCQHEDVHEVAALGHSWATEFTIDTPATCTTVGSESHHCTRCDAKRDVTEIPALGHTEVVDAAVAATCTETGLTEGKHCSVCNEVIIAQQTVSALGHDHTVAQHDDSQHWMKCSRCDSTTAKTDHSYDAHSCDVSAKCKDCDYEKPAGQHSYGDYTQTKAPTCTENGSEKAVCTVCQHEDVHEVAALGHSWATEFTIDTPATCTTVGSESHHCTRCDAKRDVTEIPALGHTEVVDAAVAATCTETGLTEGKHCSVCNAVLVAQETVPATGHSFATEWTHDDTNHWHAATCAHTEEKSGLAEHSWNNGEVTTPATGTQNGVKIYTCAVCEAKKTEVIPASYASVSTVTELEAAMNNNDLHGAELAKDLEIPGGTLPAGKTLIVPAGRKLTVTGELRVYGTLDNRGTVLNQHFIDVFGGATLTNSGTITGSNPDENGVYGSSLGIEGGATLDNASGTINDCIAVADYYFANPEDNKLCKVNGSFDVASNNFDKIAVVFDAEKIQTLLKDNSYEIVMPCGTNNGENTVELVEITVPAGKVLLLKKSVFDGTNTYINSFSVAEDTTFTQTQGAFVVLKDNPSFTINGTIAFAALDESGLAQALSNSNVTEITCSGNSGNFALTEKLEIPEGKSVTVNGSLTAAKNCGIDVKAGGSLTVTGSLTLATSSTDYFMENAGSIEVQKGGSLSIGGVQYIGNGGALTLDSDNASLVLSGIPQDCASQDHPNGIFVLLTGNATVEDNKEFVVTDAWDNFILVDGATLTVNGTLINSGCIENRGTLNVYGTLNNVGSIDNQHFIDVIGGTLSNSGVINGDWRPDENGRFSYASDIGIEDGACIESDFEGAEVNDHVTVADYWRDGEPDKKCTWDAAFDPVFADGKDNPNFDVMALAFGTEQVQAALNAMSYWGENNEHSAYTYESVLACGTTPWDGTNETVNTVELGDIEVHEFGALLLKDEVFDGTDVYRNRYVISEDKTLTLQKGAALVGRSMGENSKVDLKIDGSIVNNNGFINFNQFNLSGTNAPVIVRDATELATALGTGGTIILLPFAEGDENRVEDEWEGQTVYESRYRITDSDANYTISNNTELIGLAEEGLPIAVFFDGGFTVSADKTLKFNGLNVVAAADSTIYGTVEAHNGILVVQGKNTGATLTNNGTIVVGQPNEWGALAIFAEEENNKIVNNGTIENFGDLVFDRDRQKGQFEGNEPIEYASLRDLVCELYHRFNAYNNMAALEENDTKHVLVKAYPDHEQMMNAENPNESDNDALDAFSWFIKNGIIPQYNKETSPKLNPFDLVTKTQAAELLNKLATKIKGSNVTVTLTGDGLICKTAVNGRSELDDCVIAVRKAIGENIVQNAAELAAALANGGKIYLLPLAQKTEVTFAETGEKSYESQYHLTNACTISEDTELIKLGDENEPIAVFFDDGFTVAQNAKLKINGLNIVAVKGSTVNGTVEAHNGIVVVQGAEGTTLRISTTGKIVVGQPNEWGALAIFAEEGVDNKIVNNGTIENFGDLIFDRNPEKGQFEGNEPIEYVNLRDLVCELYHRFDGMPNMNSVDYKTKNDEGGIVDLGSVYAYPDGGSQMFNEENPDDSDYEAIGAFSWFIKNGIIPEHDETDNRELRPYDRITKTQAADLLNKLGNKIADTAEETYSTLSGSDYLCRTENIAVPNEEWKTSELRQAVDGLEAHFASLRSVSVISEKELMTALDKPYVTEIHVTQSMTILGTPDSSDTNFGGCFYLNNEGRNGDLNIYIHGVATLTVGDAEHTTKLDIGGGVKVTLIQIETGYAKVVASKDSCINVFGELNVSGGWQHDDYYTGNINFFPDVMEFGKRLLERVGAYGLDPMTGEERTANFNRAGEWPNNDDDRIGGFEFLVKHGNLAPHTEKDDQGNDYNVWRPYDKITYGEAMTVLRGVYKAIAGQDKQLPNTVALGEGDWKPMDTDCISDHDVEDLLNKFVAALPQINDSTTESFTVENGQDRVISNKSFSNPITITCDKTKTNDSFGGDIKFENCAFNGGVTVEMTAGVGYNVSLNNSCTGAFTVIAENDVIGQEHTNVNFFGMNGVTINGLSINGDIANVRDVWDDDFNVNVRYDEDGEDDNGKKYISTVEIRNSTENLVTVAGSYTGKLRVAGKLDISGVTLGANSRIELSNQCDSEIALGSNDILVNDDCGGSYTFTGTDNSEVTVPNQNQYAKLKVNNVYLDTPHIFGRDSFGIFLPLNSTDGVTLTVKQGETELGYTVQNKGDGGINLQAADVDSWINKPYQVKLTVTIDGCTVVYDTMMWKPVQLGEFVEELNQKLSRTYALQSLGLAGDEGTPLTFGACKTAFEEVLADFDKTDVEMRTIINDDGYWDELTKWTGEYQQAKTSGDENWIRDMENRNPNNWTRHWNDLDVMLGALKDALDISETESNQ